MRLLVKISLMIVLVAGLASCKKIKGLFDVEFDTTLSGNVDIDIQDPVVKSTNDYDFEAFKNVDPTDDPDIEEYLENIKEFAVSGVVAEVLNVSKEGVIFKSGTSFIVADNNSEVSWTLSEDWEVFNGTTLNLEDMGGVYDAIEEILDKKASFKVGVTGTSTETGVFITIKIGIDTEVTANPL